MEVIKKISRSIRLRTLTDAATGSCAAQSHTQRRVSSFERLFSHSGITIGRLMDPTYEDGMTPIRAECLLDLAISEF